MLVVCNSVLPVFCKVEIGTSITKAWQLNFATASLPPWLAFLKLPTSKAPPKSTKKGSSTGPANTFSPVVAVAIASVIN